MCCTAVNKNLSVSEMAEKGRSYLNDDYLNAKEVQKEKQLRKVQETMDTGQQRSTQAVSAAGERRLPRVRMSVLSSRRADGEKQLLSLSLEPQCEAALCRPPRGQTGTGLSSARQLGRVPPCFRAQPQRLL